MLYAQQLLYMYILVAHPIYKTEIICVALYEKILFTLLATEDT